MEALDGATLPEALDILARVAPSASVTFPGRGALISAGELAPAARRFALALAGLGVRREDLVGLLLPPGPDVLKSIFGTLHAGAAVVALPVRHVGQDPRGQAAMLARIADTAGMRHLIAGPEYAEIARELCRLCPQLTAVRPDLSGGSGALPDITPHDLAFVQYTSGSTAAPKGVMVPHRAMLAGLRATVHSGALRSSDALVSWVPHFHDMGMFNLMTLLAGADIHVVSPLEFIRNPGRVLMYFARCGGTLFTSPNFGYEHMLRALGTGDDPDLSRWRLAGNGAEPVAARTVRRFAELLGPHGVGPAVMFPVYGMAEVAAAITTTVPGSVPLVRYVHRDLLADHAAVRELPADHPAARALVSVGRPLPGLDVRIADADGAARPEASLGEIQVRGEAVMSGYLEAPEATRAAFDGDWLRTGDLGFRLDGELFVSGRSKDMIIVHGRNYFPEDVEEVLWSLPGIHHGNCVAFASADPDGTEHLGVAVETEGGPEAAGALVEAVLGKVGAALDLPADSVRVHVVAVGVLPRTTSGKWRRGRARREFQGRPTASANQ